MSRERAAERDERIVREAGPWKVKPDEYQNNMLEPWGGDQEKFVWYLRAAARILNRLAKKGKR